MNLFISFVLLSGEVSTIVCFIDFFSPIYGWLNFKLVVRRDLALKLVFVSITAVSFRRTISKLLQPCTLSALHRIRQPSFKIE